MWIAARRMPVLWPRFLCLALAAVFVSVLLALMLGAVAIAPQQLALWFVGQAEPQSQLIIQSLRLPRALLAAAVGAVLAVCGAATQGLFRNPLADPSLIGVSAGAAAGASVVIVLLNHLQWHFLGLSLVSFGAFAGAMAVVFLVYRLAAGPAGTSVATMLLAGIAFSYLAGSFANVLEFVADNQMLRQISLWRMGGLDGADFLRVVMISVVLAGVFAVLYRHHKALNALLLGESEARHLGINVSRVKQHVIICVAAGVGVSVALAGTISFVGLVVPHMVRMVVGPNHKYLLPLSACAGAVLLVLADVFARTVLAPTELPVGLLTALLGAPLFISLLRKRHQYGMQ